MASDGTNLGGSRSRGAPLPHIEDITAAPQDIDGNQSLKRLLESAEQSFSSAEMSREFKRPATALKDYIRAYIIAVMVIQKHHEYNDMRDDMKRRHNALLRHLKGLYDVYEGLKQYIREDNAITKVQPTRPHKPTSTATSNGPIGPVRASLDISPSSNRHTTPTTNGSGVKSKPALKPKPQSLHGNVLSSQHGRSPSAPSGATDALAARFASLRGPQASPGQDPRIKTHSFALPPRPSGPRDMPPAQKPKIGVDSSVDTLPKMPEAIYSPVRGNMSQESASLPTSTPRGFSRTGSGTSNAGTPGAHQVPGKDYFSPVVANVMSAEPSSLGRRSMDTGSAVSSPRVSVDVASHKAQTKTIEAEELYRAMKTTGTVLIIDVRSREEFEEGHIMSSSIICIEPAVLSRKDLSAEDISQSLVLHENEQKLFDSRHEFDLIVFYDEASQIVPRVPRGPTGYALMSFQRALVDLNFGSTLKQQPKLLGGGLEAWIELMGANSLQSSPTLSPKIRGGLGSLQKHPSNSHPHILRRASKYRVQPLKADDIRAWQETINKEDSEAVSPSFHRTTEDFFKRFPEVPIEPEDMAPVRSQRSEPRTHPYQPERPRAQREDQVEQFASPPQRPAPAVPRPSHSGLTNGAYHEEEANGQLTTTTSQSSALSDSLQRLPAGLENPGNWCYSNSVLQAISATRFGRIIEQADWKRNPVPRKDNEAVENPRLMMSILQSLFSHMRGGALRVLNPDIIMRFCHSMCKQAKTQEIFGDTEQHDASEYFGFLMTYVDEESNMVRHLYKKEVPQPNSSRQSPLQYIHDFWKDFYSVKHRSLVDQHFTHFDMTIVQCHKCKNKTYMASHMQALNVTVPKSRTPVSLSDALSATFESNVVPDYQCDCCHSRGDATIRKVHPFMPETLCLSFNRFQPGAGYMGGVLKIDTSIQWDLNDVDMAPYFLQPDECQWHPKGDEKLDKAFCGQMRYETVAIVQHSGRTAGSGHYTAHVRDTTTNDRNAWLMCNDTRVTKLRLDTDSQRKKVFKDGQRVPYMVFLQRKMAYRF